MDSVETEPESIQGFGFGFETETSYKFGFPFIIYKVLNSAWEQSQLTDMVQKLQHTRFSVMLNF
jgi:hypothetical protein